MSLKIWITQITLTGLTYPPPYADSETSVEDRAGLGRDAHGAPSVAKVASRPRPSRSVLVAAAT